MRWPVLTIVGVAAAVIVGIVHASLGQALDCLLGADDLGPRHVEWADGFGPDGYL